MSKTNVLFLHSQNRLGADSTIHAHLMRYLDREHFAVHVACSTGDGSQESREALDYLGRIPDVRLRPTAFAPGFRHRSRQAVLRGAVAAAIFPVDFARLVAYVLRERISIIHATDRPRDAVYAVALAKLTGARAIVHVHVAWSSAYAPSASWGIRSADAVFAISQFVAETVVATGVERERVHTVLNCVDVSRWDPATSGDAVRREYGIPDAAPVVASVSRLFAGKGQRELLRAFALVRAQIPEARLLVVGADAPHLHKGSFTAELQELAAELGLADAVVFTGQRSDVARIMASCDVFSLPSHEEPFGLVYLEAMAMQRPVVALNDGGTPEVVEHGRSGLLSASRDLEGLAKNMVALLRDPDLRARMGAYGRSRVIDYFNAERMARDAERAYRSVLSS